MFVALVLAAVGVATMVYAAGSRISSEPESRTVMRYGLGVGGSIVTVVGLLYLVLTLESYRAS